MSDPDVTDGEMFDKSESDKETEALLRGQAWSTTPPQVVDFVALMKQQVYLTEVRESDPMLAEFLNVTAPVAAHKGEQLVRTRRERMASQFGAAVATTAGKVLIGVSVVTASIGGMHAAGADVPMLPDVVSSDSPAQDHKESKSEKPLKVELPDKAQNDKARNDKAQNEKKDNHGPVVSEHAKETELEGCEKGQSVSELASQKSDDVRQNEDNSNDPCSNEKEASAADSSNRANGSSAASENGNSSDNAKAGADNGKSDDKAAGSDNAKGTSGDADAGTDNGNNSDNAKAGTDNGKSDDKAAGSDNAKGTSGDADAGTDNGKSDGKAAAGSDNAKGKNNKADSDNGKAVTDSEGTKGKGAANSGKAGNQNKAEGLTDD